MLRFQWGFCSNSYCLNLAYISIRSVFCFRKIKPSKSGTFYDKAYDTRVRNKKQFKTMYRVYILLSIYQKIYFV